MNREKGADYSRGILTRRSTMALRRRALFYALFLCVISTFHADGIRRRRNDSPRGADDPLDVGPYLDAKDDDNDDIDWASNWMTIALNDSDVDSYPDDPIAPNSIQSSEANEVETHETRTVETTTILSSSSSSYSSGVPTAGVIASVGNGVRPPTTRSIVETSDPFNSALPLTELVVIGGYL